MRPVPSCLCVPVILVLWSLTAGAPLQAEIGAADVVPAATLLLPYFEVDVRPGNGRPTDLADVTTFFSINNAKDVPTIAHVTLWTDLAIPTFVFDVYLTGYDVQTFNLADLLVRGRIPPTESQDLTGVSPVGLFSELTNPDSGVGPNSPSCAAELPVAPLEPAVIAHLQAAHTGKPSSVLTGLCAGVDYSRYSPTPAGQDEIARGYVTVDSVNFCTMDTSRSPGFFAAGGNGTANNLNQLWGDYFYVNPAQRSAQGATLVHLEADNRLGAANYTFYRLFSSGADQREGLFSSFGTRYITGGAFSGGTRLAVWRDPKRIISPFSCNLLYPSPFPLGQEPMAVFDETENPVVLPCGPQHGNFLPFPLAAQATRLGLAGAPQVLQPGQFPVPYPFGWMFMDLNFEPTGSLVPFEPATQNWVTVMMEALGTFSVGYEAMVMDNVTVQ